jgi:acyl-CoA synthetase (AMP-forming)/AMP-acid ligase II
MYLTQGLHRALQRHPARVALSHLGAQGLQTWTWAQLVDGVARRARALQQQGVQPGDRVALLGVNSAQLVQGLLACWWLGAVACPLNVRWSAPELAAALDDARPALLLCDAALQPLVAGCALPQRTLDRFDADAQAAAPLPDRRCGGDALAALLYTGGTTGRSKGVMLGHANFWAASMTRGAELNNPPQSVSLLVAPLFHVAGLGRLVGQLIVGGSCVTLPQFRADAVLQAIAELGISDIIVVPSMLQALLDHPQFDAAQLQGLSRIAFGAAPMPPDLLDRALAAWPQAEFFQAYGLTETAGAVCINPPSTHRGAQRHGPRLHAVGRAGLGAEIRVCDEQGDELPRGQVGEIVVRGAMVMQGYWRQPEASAAALRDGWLHTGDAGRMDDEGWLYVVDRLKDMIISGGENVYSAEVEAALRGHAAVQDAAVVGRPDTRWGEAVHAVLVLHAGQAATADELQAWCRTRLAGYKCPRSFQFVDALPMSAAGKVLKNTLRAQANA